MHNWLPYRDAFLETIIGLEGPKDRRTCAGCSTYSSPWRCIDCLDFPSLCTACCLKRHEHDFLHRIEKWTPAKVNSDQAGGRESGDSAPPTEDHAGSDDEDEDDEDEDEDEAARGEDDDREADMPVPPVTEQGPIDTDEGRLHLGWSGWC